VCVVIATKPVHRFQICPIVHSQRAPPTIPPSYSRVRAVVWECSEGQHTHTHTHTHTNTQTVVANIHFTSATPHAKCNQRQFITLVAKQHALFHCRQFSVCTAVQGGLQNKSMRLATRSLKRLKKICIFIGTFQRRFVVNASVLSTL